MNNYAEYLARAIVPGSTIYYCLRAAPASVQAELRIINAWFLTIRANVLGGREINLALNKLNWWYQETAQIFLQQATHPLAQQLQKIIPQYNLPPSAFNDFLSGLALELQAQPAATWEEFATPIYWQWQIPCALSALILARTKFETMELTCLDNYVTHLARGCADIYLLNNFAHLASRYPLAADPASLPTLLAPQANNARHSLQTALDLLSSQPGLSATQIPLLIFANQHLALLNLIEKNNFPVFNTQFALSPLHKLWISWRTQRRFRSQGKRS